MKSIRRTAARHVATLGLAALALSGLGPVAAGAAPSTSSSTASTPAAQSTIAAFTDPAQGAKAMVRMWFPDAEAGVEDGGYLDLVEKQINDLAAGGFGGVEIAYLSDRPAATNAQLGEIGWATPAWKRILEKVLTTANAEKNKFQVDLTITAHWPPSVNNIDFNDPGASQEASQAYTKITATDLANGSMSLPLPTRKNADRGNVPFVFTDSFDSSAVARVASVGSDGKPVLELASLQDVSSETTKRRATADEVASGDYRRVNGVNYAGSAAGVPDQATATALGVDYQNSVVGYWGPEQADPDETAKIDDDGNRKRMADWQYAYSTDLAEVPALQGATLDDDTTLKAGDYVLVGNYYRGTGQVQSGGSKYGTSVNHPAATNYFSKAGAQAIFDVWNDRILDPQMKSLLRANGGSIFEDSIEGQFSTKPWTKGVTSAVADQTGLDASKYASALVGSAVSFDDADQLERIREDYATTLGHLYETEHASLISDWASTFGYNYRAQAYTLEGLDIGAAASALDIPEGDNSSSGDGVRTLSGVLNVTGSGTKLSMESVTATATRHSPWSQVIRLLNADASDGVSRVILHGSAFAKSFDSSYNAWPGWNFSEFLAMNSRQAWWDQVGDFTGYVNRMQAVLQSGQRKVDVAVLLGSEDGYDFMSGNSMQDLLDHGYSYNVLTEPIWSGDDATVGTADGKPVLNADGPAYQALVLDGAETMSLDGMDKLLAFARAGMPIAVLDSAASRVYGTDGGTQDSELATKLTQLLAEPSVEQVDSVEAARSFIEAQGTTPSATYDAKHLEATHIANTEGDYYYLYNDGMSVLTAAAAGDTQLDVYDEEGATEVGDVLTVGQGRTAEKVTVTAVTHTPTGDATCIRSDALSGCPTVLTLAEPLKFKHVGLDTNGKTRQRGEVVSAFDSTKVTLQGSGTPYTLDLETGEITPIAQYVDNGGSISFDLDLPASSATVVALATDTAGFPQVGKVHAVASSGGTVVYQPNGTLALHATEPGTYTVDLSDGTTRTVTVDAVPQGADLSTDWDLSIENWGPDAAADTVDPTVSKKTDLSFTDVSLGSWLDELTLTDEQKEAADVSGIDQVVGNARYQRTFELPDDWDGSTAGADLTLEHGYDNITGVTVNGTTFDTVDQLTDVVHVPASALRAGTNTLEVDISTSLTNRAGWTTSPQDQGLFDVGWSPYASVALTKAAQPALRASVAVAPARPNGTNGWYTSAPRVTVSGTSSDGSKPVLQVKVGAAGWRTYSGPFAVPAQGSTQIQARAVVGSMVSPVASTTVRLDSQAPTALRATKARHGKKRVLRLKATDTVSGVARIWFKVAGTKKWKAYRQPIKVGSGSTKVSFYAVDRAGNRSLTRMVKVRRG